MVEKELFDGIINTIKPDCEDCNYYAEVYRTNRIVHQCSQKKCIFETIASNVVNFLDKNYKIKKI